MGHRCCRNDKNKHIIKCAHRLMNCNICEQRRDQSSRIVLWYLTRNSDDRRIRSGNIYGRKFWKGSSLRKQGPPYRANSYEKGPEDVDVCWDRLSIQFLNRTPYILTYWHRCHHYPLRYLSTAVLLQYSLCYYFHEY
jgi:hypothetical protein